MDFQAFFHVRTPSTCQPAEMDPIDRRPLTIVGAKFTGTPGVNRGLARLMLKWKQPRSKRLSHFGSAAATLAVVLVTIVAPSRAGETSAEFKAENDAAMDKMMTGMAIRYTGGVDRDFADMMIPHHQGAIDMAEAELRHGHNEQLRRIAQEIIVEQQQEIAAMRLALGEALPASVPAPTRPAPTAGSPAPSQHDKPMPREHHP
jgi:hypothetical protein